MAISDNIKKLRAEHNLSQQELGMIAGVSDKAVSTWELGIKTPRMGAVEKMSQHFGIPKSRILDIYDVKESVAESFPAPEITDNYVTFPVIGDIAAGYDNLAIEGWEGDTVQIPSLYLKGRPRKDFFVLRVKGDSMYPLYHEGDKVLILRQSTLNASGEIGAVIYDDDIGTLKKVEFVKGEDWMRLVPINPNIPPIMIEGERLEHCRVIGIPRLMIREIN